VSGAVVPLLPPLLPPLLVVLLPPSCPPDELRPLDPPDDDPVWTLGGASDDEQATKAVTTNAGTRGENLRGCTRDWTMLIA